MTVFARNLLRGNRRKNIFWYFVLMAGPGLDAIELRNVHQKADNIIKQMMEEEKLKCVGILILTECERRRFCLQQPEETRAAFSICCKFKIFFKFEKFSSCLKFHLYRCKR